jgi:hypothetical protein
MLIVSSSNKNARFAWQQMPEKQGDSGWFRNRKSGVLPAMPIARNISWRIACNRIRNPDSAQKVQYSDAIVRDSHPLSRKVPQINGISDAGFSRTLH